MEQINAETRDEYGQKAGGYLAQMEKFSTFFGLKLSHLIFSGIEQLSLTLQGKDTTIQEAIIAAELAIGHLQRQRKDDVFNSFYSLLRVQRSSLHLPLYQGTDNLLKGWMIHFLLVTGFPLQKVTSENNILKS